ncbi:hypothetical protein OVA24_08205 [Luteolibacter sp. SL250]|uniref:hypothetical protein n=1 Tax=Luteolibacter sp. SL250 TaxID=2995170 RepID=UPI00226EA825|nr:hypothetical protein [Luteolibacter sp. SL250]WAC21367.1 hypothetical protein OVA24_08205 [Luteolibacter sp. SL250]
MELDRVKYVADDGPFTRRRPQRFAVTIPPYFMSHPPKTIPESGNPRPVKKLTMNITCLDSVPDLLAFIEV